MNKEEEFDRRIAAIYNLNRYSLDAGAEVMDIRHAEFQAMTDVFLGEHYDEAKLSRVESMQIALQEQQAVLYQRYEANKISPSEYVRLFNTLIEFTFEACENILGPKDFLKLFGCPLSLVEGFVDEKTFISAEAERRREDAPLVQDITTEAEPGQTYLGKVTRIMDFGAFIEIFPGTEGLLHVSEIAPYRVHDVHDELAEGQQVLVKCLAVEGNKIRLSKKALLETENDSDEKKGHGQSAFRDRDRHSRR